MLDTDVQVLDTDVQVLDTDVQVLDTDVQVLDTDVQVLDTDVQVLDTFLGGTENRSPTGSRDDGGVRVGGWLCEVRRMAQRRVDTPAQLRRVIAQLPSEQPFTDRFSAKWERSGTSAGRQQERRDVWYQTQHEHWLGWLGEYDGPGAYGRQDGPRSAEFVYNHVVNPQMLIYLAEALEIEVAVLRSAQRDALAQTTMMAMSAAIRRVVPWRLIEAAIAGRAQAAPRERRPRVTPSPPKG